MDHLKKQPLSNKSNNSKVTKKDIANSLSIGVIGGVGESSSIRSTS